MFAFFYLLIGAALYVIAVPFLLLLIFYPKYRRSVPARFFLWRNPPFQERRLWFHACSFGEVKALEAVVAMLDEPVNVTVVTDTGYEAAGEIAAERRFLPFEIFLPFWIRPQKALVVLEAELWYMLFYTAKKRGMPVFLLNARISDRSYRRYLFFRRFYRRIFENIDIVFAQSQKDKKRLEALGAKRVEVTGNIKAYRPLKPKMQLPKPEGETVVLASTHEKEEALLLSHLRLYQGRRVIVVPRHPERFEAVGQLLEKIAAQKGLSFARFSQDATLTQDIVLVDKMGVLVDIYAIADVVVLGGSFIDGIGGHNPLEPAHFGVKLISGKYIFNQEALFPMVRNVVFSEYESIELSISRAKPVVIENGVDLSIVREALQSVV